MRRHAAWAPLLAARAALAEKAWHDGIPGIRVFSPLDASQEEVDSIFEEQRNAQFEGRRYALLLTSGVYPEDFLIRAGYYTSVLGVGTSPDRVRLKSVQSLNGANGHATNNFWRSFEGLSLWADSVVWAVSQASPLRRSIIENDLYLSDEAGYSSGGFIADVKVVGRLATGTQQQWFFRNADFQGGIACPGGWNYVFMGVNGLAPPTMKSCSGGIPGKVTVVDHTPRIAEKPYLVREDDGNTWNIYVPRYINESSSGMTVNLTAAIGKKLALDSEVFIARAGQTEEEINAGLAGKKGVLFTPGVYSLKAPVRVEKDGFVVLGIGYPTLIATAGLPALQVSDGLTDVRVAGLLLEAGTVKGPNRTEPLLSWGTKPHSRPQGRGEAAGVMSDIFVRVGSFKYRGCHVVRADTLMEVNSNDAVLDNVWLWHADHDDCGTDPEHGKYGKSDDCYSTHGLVVNADKVTAYALAAEHIVAGDNAVWNGEEGETYFYQCELPYHNLRFGDAGYTGYAVNPSVGSHSAVGLGVYIIGNSLKVKSAFRMPRTAKARNLFNVVIQGNATQFKNIACVHPDKDGSERCYGPESCASIRCYLASVPLGEPKQNPSRLRQKEKTPTGTPATPKRPSGGPASGPTTQPGATQEPGEGSHERPASGGLAPCDAATAWSPRCVLLGSPPLPFFCLLTSLVFFAIVLIAPFRSWCESHWRSLRRRASFAPLTQTCEGDAKAPLRTTEEAGQ